MALFWGPLQLFLASLTILFSNGRRLPRSECHSFDIIGQTTDMVSDGWRHATASHFDLAWTYHRSYIRLTSSHLSTRVIIRMSIKIFVEALGRSAHPRNAHARRHRGPSRMSSAHEPGDAPRVAILALLCARVPKPCIAAIRWRFEEPGKAPLLSGSCRTPWTRLWTPLK
ncbi:hypothetical protein BDR07DRAFT_785802 [Suillus spraguei]|nr:hypothetical protein BDR07DRAFT_785802 [Suillus spraguei]